MTIIEEIAKKELPSNQAVHCGCGFDYKGSARWDELMEFYDNHECYPEPKRPRPHWTYYVFGFWPCITMMFVVGMIPLILSTLPKR